MDNSERKRAVLISTGVKSRCIAVKGGEGNHEGESRARSRVRYDNR